MSIFGVCKSTDGHAYVRLPDGTWRELRNGETWYVELTGPSDIRDRKKNRASELGETLADALELELSKARRRGEKEGTG